MLCGSNLCQPASRSSILFLRLVPPGGAETADFTVAADDPIARLMALL